MPYAYSTELFDDAYVCIYGGFSFNPWQLKSWDDPDELNDPFGEDEEPGVANQDDDMDGETDNRHNTEYGTSDESPAQKATTVNNGFGNREGRNSGRVPTGSRAMSASTTTRTARRTTSARRVGRARTTVMTRRA